VMEGRGKARDASSAPASPVGLTRPRSRREALFLGGAVSGASLLPGCLSLSTHQYLDDIYEPAARRHGPDRNPIVVIPGILGSRLVHDETGETVWGVLGGGHLREHFGNLAFPMERGRSLAALSDPVEPGEVLDRLRVNLGATVEVKAYAQLLAALGVGGYRDETLGRSGAIDYGDEHYTCFQFGYDWRRSTAENARRLHRFLLRKKAYVERENRRRFGDTSPVRFDLVAHSMGGLVARHYLRHGGSAPPEDGSPPAVTWAGAEHVEKAILVATPNAGSALAAKQLVEGWRPAPFLREFPPALLGTMPSLYELLPRTRHGKVLGPDGETLDLLEPAEWSRRGLGLLAPDQDPLLARLLPTAGSPAERRAIASDHLRKCLAGARRLHESLDRSARLPGETRLYLFAGDATETPDVLRIEESGNVREEDSKPGDGTVTRDSALLAETDSSGASVYRSPVDWTHATFIAADHRELTSDPTFTDNVLHLLLET